VAPGERAEMQAQVLGLQSALQRAEMAVVALTQSLNTDMEQRSKHLVSTIWSIVGGIVVLAVLLVLGVVEPTARAVRRQYEKLSYQADRLSAWPRWWSSAPTRLPSPMAPTAWCG